MDNDTRHQVDSFRFVPFLVKKMMLGWTPKQPVEQIPWTPMPKPLASCRVALISSAGLALADDTPFDQQGERERPWWGDPSIRRIPRGTRRAVCYHQHINRRPVEQDLNCVLPLQRLDELVAAGKVGSSAATHYSFMGYILDADDLLQRSVPQLIDGLRREEVDLALLVPV